MENIKLVNPAKEHEHKAFDYIQEFLLYKSEINGTGGLSKCNDYDQWLEKIQNDSNPSVTPQGKAPANTYFYIRESDDNIIGMINIRHYLNDILLKRGGHIGYSIRPTERNKGYATLMLKAGLEKCRELNLQKVLITCDKANIASAKVIQKSGGILENEIYSDTYKQVVQRYWITI